MNFDLKFNLKFRSLVLYFQYLLHLLPKDLLTINYYQILKLEHLYSLIYINKLYKLFSIYIIKLNIINIINILIQ